MKFGKRKSRGQTEFAQTSEAGESVQTESAQTSEAGESVQTEAAQTSEAGESVQTEAAQTSGKQSPAKKSKSTHNQPPKENEPKKAKGKSKSEAVSKKAKHQAKPKFESEPDYQVYVGGIGDLNEQRLVEYFSQFGAVKCALAVKLKGKPRGFGFVTFMDKEGVEKAAGTTQIIDGKSVTCAIMHKEGVEKSVACRSISKKEEQDGWECFVGGLPKSVEAGVLENYFKEYGVVSGARIMIDAVSQQSRGFGFVQFASKDNIAAVLDGKHTIEGAVVSTKIAENKKEKQTPIEKGNDAIFLGGLPKIVAEQDLRELCAQFGTVDEVVLKIDSATGNSRGFAFISFSNHKAFTKCLEAAQKGALSFQQRQLSARPARSKSSKDSYYPKGKKLKKAQVENKAAE